MLLLLDTANLEEIRKFHDLYCLDGVTTNPTIISKEKRDVFKTLKSIRRIIGESTMLHVQTLGRNCEEIVSEGMYLTRQIPGSLYIKVPVTPEGIKAIKILKEKGIKVTANCSIYTAPSIGGS